MGAAIAIVVRPHWVGGWFLRAVAVPFVRVDGAEHRVGWNRPLRLAVQPGTRLVGAGIRYRGMRRGVGCRPSAVTVPPAATVRLVARNGPLNSEPFRVRVLP